VASVDASQWSKGLTVVKMVLATARTIELEVSFDPLLAMGYRHCLSYLTLCRNGEIMCVRGLDARKYNKTFPRRIIVVAAPLTHANPSNSGKQLLRANFVPES
jgi:hypothetical protein